MVHGSVQDIDVQFGLGTLSLVESSNAREDEVTMSLSPLASITPQRLNRKSLQAHWKVQPFRRGCSLATSNTCLALHGMSELVH